MSPTPEDWKRAAEAHGPHNQHFIQVYANPQARGALRRHSTTPLPVGSVIGKDKLLKSDSSEPQGTAFMIKRSGARFKATGGWEFLASTSRPAQHAIEVLPQTTYAESMKFRTSV